MIKRSHLSLTPEWVFSVHFSHLLHGSVRGLERDGTHRNRSERYAKNCSIQRGGTHCNRSEGYETDKPPASSQYCSHPPQGRAKRIACNFFIQAMITAEPMQEPPKYVFTSSFFPSPHIVTQHPIPVQSSDLIGTRDSLQAPCAQHADKNLANATREKLQ